MNLFLTDFGGKAPGEAVYVIWIGANDLNDALTALASDPTGGASTSIIEAALGAIADNIQALWAAGGRSFLILNAPDLGLTPALEDLGPAAAGAGTELSTGFNAGLAQVVGDFKEALPGIDIKTLDAFTLLHTIVGDPRAFHIEDAQDPCLTFYVVKDAICRRPNSHLFWDGTHPTVAGHEIIEDAAARTLRARCQSRH